MSWFEALFVQVRTWRFWWRWNDFSGSRGKTVEELQLGLWVFCKFFPSMVSQSPNILTVSLFWGLHKFTQATRGWLSHLRPLCDTSQSKRHRPPAGKGLKGNPRLWARSSSCRSSTSPSCSSERLKQEKIQRLNAWVSRWLHFQHHTSFFWEVLQHHPGLCCLWWIFLTQIIRALSSQRGWPVGHQFTQPPQFSEADCPKTKFRNEDFSHRSFLCSSFWQRQWRGGNDWTDHKNKDYTPEALLGLERKWVD